MGRMVEGAGVALHVTERGDGPATVLLHGMAADQAVWDLDAVPGRAVAYDRRGYGASGAPEPYGATTVHEQAEDAAAVLRATRAAPAVVVGQDLAALVCLDLLVRHRDLVRAAVLVDPPVFAFAPGATEALSSDRQALEQALRDGGPQEAVARWLGPEAGEDRLRRARTAARAFFADYSALATWPVRRADLRGLDVPVAVVVSAGAAAHVRTAAEALEDLLPDAHRAAGVPEALANLS